MKKILFALIVTMALIAILGGIRITFRVDTMDVLTHQQRAWLGALEWCESRGVPEAVNPRDLDDTPSYGILQFKPSTLEYFKKAYKIEGRLMDPRTQEQIVEQMIIRGGIDWHHQFPGCTKKLGNPPK